MATISGQRNCRTTTKFSNGVDMTRCGLGRVSADPVAKVCMQEQCFLQGLSATASTGKVGRFESRVFQKVGG